MGGPRITLSNGEQHPAACQQHMGWTEKCPPAETCPPGDLRCEPGIHPHTVGSESPAGMGHYGQLHRPRQSQNYQAMIIFTYTFRDAHPFKRSSCKGPKDIRKIPGQCSFPRTHPLVCPFSKLATPFCQPLRLNPRSHTQLLFLSPLISSSSANPARSTFEIRPRPNH